MQYPQTRYEDNLSVGITDTDLSCVASVTAPSRTQGIITLGRKQSNTEDAYFTNVVGNTITIGIRGLSSIALTPTQVIGNRKVHLANESIEITTHHNYDTDKFRKTENETITGLNTFSALQIFSVSPKQSVAAGALIPSALTAGAPTTGGSVNDGAHSYIVTFITAAGEETMASTPSNIINCGSGNNTVLLTNIPVGDATGNVTGRKIYRTVAGNTGKHLLVTTIADNTTVTYSDTLIDGSLGASEPTSANSLELMRFNETVRTTDPQTIASLKTFTTAPQTSVAPVAGNDLANKTYVDSRPAQNTSLGTLLAGETLASRDSLSYEDMSNADLLPPTALTAAAPVSGGSVTDGAHSYKVTFVNVTESVLGAVSNQIVCGSGNNLVTLSAIPTGTAGTTQRKIYRTKAGDTGSYFLVATINDNSTTTYLDTIADGSLGAAGAVGDAHFGRTSVTFGLYQAQSFLVSTVPVAFSMAFWLSKVGSPVDNITVEIQADNAGSPSGTPVANGVSNAVVGSTLATTYGATAFTWASLPTMAAATRYWAVLKRSGSQSDTNYYRVQYNSVSAFRSGSAKLYSSSWGYNVGANDALVFTITGISPVIVKSSQLLNNSQRQLLDWVGFSNASASVGASVTAVNGGILEGFTSLTKNAQYFVDSSVGGITVTQNFPTAVSVGYAITPTAINLSKAILPIPTDQIVVTLGETVTAGQPLRIRMNDGKAYKCSEFADNSPVSGFISASGQSFPTSTGPVWFWQLASNTFIVATLVAANQINFQVGTLSNGMMTLGTAITNASVVIPAAGFKNWLCVATATKFAYVYKDSATNTLKMVICTVSGVTITQGSAVQESATTTYTLPSICCTNATGNPTFMVTANNTTTDNKVWGVTSVTTSPTWGTASAVEATVVSAQPLIVSTATNTALVIYEKTATTIKAAVISETDHTTSIIVNTPTTLDSTITAFQGFSNIYSLTTTKAYFFIVDLTASGVYALKGYLPSISGTVPSAPAPVTVWTATSASSQTTASDQTGSVLSNASWIDLITVDSSNVVMANPSMWNDTTLQDVVYSSIPANFKGGLAYLDVSGTAMVVKQETVKYPSSYNGGYINLYWNTGSEYSPFVFIQDFNGIWGTAKTNYLTYRLDPNHFVGWAQAGGNANGQILAKTSRDANQSNLIPNLVYRLGASGAMVNVGNGKPVAIATSPTTVERIYNG